MEKVLDQSVCVHDGVSAAAAANVVLIPLLLLPTDPRRLILVDQVREEEGPQGRRRIQAVATVALKVGLDTVPQVGAKAVDE